MECYYPLSWFWSHTVCMGHVELFSRKTKIRHMHTHMHTNYSYACICTNYWQKVWKTFKNLSKKQSCLFCYSGYYCIGWISYPGLPVYSLQLTYKKYKSNSSPWVWMQWKLWKTCWVFNAQVLHLAEEKDRGAWARVASRETLSSQNTLEEKESVITVSITR